MATKGSFTQCYVCSCATVDEHGSFDICPVCFWEDDGFAELDTPNDGPNGELSISQARDNFQKFGVARIQDLEYVRPLMEEELVRGLPPADEIAHCQKKARQKYGLDKKHAGQIEELAIIILRLKIDLEAVLGSKNVAQFFDFDVKALSLTTKFDNDSLNLTVDLGCNAWVSYFYSARNYSNYSEGVIMEGATLKDISDEIYEVLTEFLKYDTYRIDKYAGKKLVSSKLKTATGSIVDNRAFRPLIRKQKVQICYIAPLKEYFQ